jgi:hypothetical protein
MEANNNKENVRLAIPVDLAFFYVRFLVLWRKGTRKERHGWCYFEEVSKETLCMVYD